METTPTSGGQTLLAPPTPPTPEPPVPTGLGWARALVFGMVAVGVVALDLGTKGWAERTLSAPADVVDGFVGLHLAKNFGAMGSIFHDAPERIRVPAFFAVTVLAVSALVLFWRRLQGAENTLRLALALVLGGALGNFADRVRYGYVIDFIDVHARGMHWPTFNVADIAITIGVAMIALRSILSKPRSVAGPTSPASLAPP